MTEVEIMISPGLAPKRVTLCETSDRSPANRPVDDLRDPSGDDLRNEADEQFGSECENGFPRYNSLENVDPNKKKKHRRGKTKKRKWKPYYKLSWQERRELEEQEAHRANSIRARMLAHGQPAAPYNTTQFLMDDHNVEEPNFDDIPGSHNRNNREQSADLSDDFYSSPEDEEDYLQRQFSEVYENIHAERLNSMCKTELVQEYMQLEVRVEELESQLKDMSSRESLDKEVQTTEGMGSFSEVCQEASRLRQENEKLRLENEYLRTMAFETPA